MIDVTTLDDRQLTTLIENHRKQGATCKPLYAAAIAEYEARYTPNLRFQTSLAYLVKAASDGRFVSYGELAEVNGAEWSKVRRPMNRHLEALLDHAHRQGWPLLSAIVVNKQKLASGEMDATALAGFIKAARSLGYGITDERAFLKEQQLACFAWAKTQGRQVKL